MSRSHGERMPLAVQIEACPTGAAPARFPCAEVRQRMPPIIEQPDPHPLRSSNCTPSRPLDLKRILDFVVSVKDTSNRLQSEIALRPGFACCC